MLRCYETGFVGHKLCIYFVITAILTLCGRISPHFLMQSCHHLGSINIPRAQTYIRAILCMPLAFGTYSANNISYFGLLYISTLLRA